MKKLITLLFLLISQHGSGAFSPMYTCPGPFACVIPTYMGIQFPDGTQQTTAATGGGGGGVTLTPFGSSPNGNGATALGSSLTLQPASVFYPGGITTGTQSFAGNKTFTGTIGASNFSGTSSGTNSGDVTLGTTNGLSLSSQVLSLVLSSTSTTGALSSTDWNTFNGKQSSLTFGNLTDVGTDGITIGNGSGSVIGSGTTISQHVADTSHNGYLKSTDWNTFSAAISALTGDVTATGPGSAATTLATVNTNIGSFGSSTSIPSFSVNGKGLITAAGGNVVVAPAGTLTGTTLASNIVTSSLTALGTIATGMWQGSVIAAAYLAAAGSNTQLQYNNSGAMGASPNLTYDGTLLKTPTTATDTIQNQSAASPNVSVNNALLNDVSNILSVDWNNRILADASSGTSVDFNNRVLKDVYGTASVDYQGRYLKDTTPIISVDYNNHILNDFNQAVSVDYANRYLYDEYDYIAVSFSTANGRYLADQTGVNQLDFDNPSGVTITNPVYEYNQDVLAGNGLASIVGIVNVLNYNAPVTNTTLYTSSNGGLFEVNAYIYVSTVGSGGNSQLTITWSDGVAGHSITTTALIGNTTGFQQITTSIVLGAGEDFVYAYSCTSCTTAHSDYGINLALTRKI